jgi:hypothetical protein
MGTKFSSIVTKNIKPLGVPNDKKNAFIWPFGHDRFRI